MTQEQHPDPVHASPAAEQLARGFPWLRFEPHLENGFWRAQFDQGLLQLRVNLFLALALVVAFTIMDRTLVPAADTGRALQLAYVVVLAGLGACLAATFVRGAWRWYQPAASLLAPVVVIALTARVLGSGSTEIQMVFPVLVLANIYVYYLIGLPFIAALRTNLIGLAAFVLGSTLADVPANLVSYQALVLFFANFVGASVAYSLETARRTSWLEAQVLAEMAERDGLTGAYNRRRLDDHLERAWRQGVRERHPMALLMVDIDCFKAFNDRYGHQAGDRALKAVANAIVRAGRRPLDFAGRYGGEEFLVVLYDTTREYAADVARTILEAVRELGIPHESSSVRPVLTVSVGVAFVTPAAERSVKGFVQLADEALYAAKHAGRDRAQMLEAEYAHLKTGSFVVDRR